MVYYQWGRSLQESVKCKNVKKVIIVKSNKSGKSQ